MRVDVGFTSPDNDGVDRCTVLRAACCDHGPFGYLCVLPYGHDVEQDHRAELDGNCCATWPVAT